MPELPEAETIARQLHARLCGQTLDRVVHVMSGMLSGSPHSLRKLVEGARISRVSRRAKRVVVSLEDRGGLVFSLGMTGHIGVAHAGDPLAKHTHLRVSLVGGREELRFRDPRRFGRIDFFDSAEGGEPEVLSGLGVEPLDMTLKEFRAIMARHRQVKALLLDQAVIAGIGNIYADEGLHRAGIHPLEIASEVDPDRVSRLCRGLKSVLRSAIKAGGSTISDYRTAEGEPGLFALQHRVYGRDDEPCRTCGAVIEKIHAAGRSSHLCPKCQPLG